MRHYDDSKDSYVGFEKLGHHRVSSARGRSSFLKRSRQLKRRDKIRQKRLGKKAVRFRIVRIPKPTPKPDPKPIGPKYDGTLASIGRILKFYPRRKV